MRHALLLTALAIASTTLADPPEPRKIQIRVTESGFHPRQIPLKKGEPVVLVFKRTTDATCMTAIDIPDENVMGLVLPLHKAVSVTVTPSRVGVEPFHCSAMEMGGGKLVVSE